MKKFFNIYHYYLHTKTLLDYNSRTQHTFLALKTKLFLKEKSFLKAWNIPKDFNKWEPHVIFLKKFYSSKQSIW